MNTIMNFWVVPCKQGSRRGVVPNKFPMAAKFKFPVCVRYIGSAISEECHGFSDMLNKVELGTSNLPFHSAFHPTRWRSVVRFTFRPLYPRGKAPGKH
jgi:hypothetical protein